MPLHDLTADMLTRIRNAQARAKREVAMPASRRKAAIAEVRTMGVDTVIVLTDMTHAALQALESDLTDVSLIVGGAKPVATDQSSSSLTDVPRVSNG